MDITTKYGINDVVYDIVNSPIRTWVECPACEGAGLVILKNGVHECPECYGRRGKEEYSTSSWHVSPETLTIGQVRSCVQNFKRSGGSITLVAMLKVGPHSMFLICVTKQVLVQALSIMRDHYIQPSKKHKQNVKTEIRQI